LERGAFVLIKAEEIAHPASTTMSSEGLASSTADGESRFARAIEEVKKGVPTFASTNRRGHLRLYLARIL
jgi:hypothetical protein